MAILIHPGRWTRQPPGGVRINSGHPLARGLTGLWLFNDLTSGVTVGTFIGGLRNVAFDGQPAYVQDATGVTFTRNSVGPAVAFANTAGVLLVSGASGYQTEFMVPTNQVTMLFGRRKTDTTLRGAYHFGVNADGAAGINRCNLTAPWSDGVVYWDFGGVAGANRLTWSGYSVGTTPEWWAVTAGLRGSAIYFNGVLKSSQATAITRTHLANASVAINGGVSLVGDLQEVFYCALLRREWSPTEVMAWYQSPYAFLQPPAPARRFFLNSVGAAADSTIGARWQQIDWGRSVQYGLRAS